MTATPEKHRLRKLEIEAELRILIKQRHKINARIEELTDALATVFA